MKGKKIVSTLLALLLLASLPVSAHAATWDIGKGDITVNAESGGQTVRQGGGAAVPDSAPVITGTSKENNVTINAEKDQTANVTLSGVNIDVRDKGKAAVSTTGEGNVSIELNGGSTLRSGYEHAGLEKNNGGSLTIADEDKNGKLIWENNIVKCGNKTELVGWDQNFASWRLPKRGWFYRHIYGDAYSSEDCEVIGNIFDNLDRLDDDDETI